MHLTMSPLYHSRVHRTFPNIHGIRQRDQLADRQRVGAGLLVLSFINTVYGYWPISIRSCRSATRSRLFMRRMLTVTRSARVRHSLGFGQANKMLKQQRAIELAAFLDGERPGAAALLKLAHTTLKLG